MLQGTTAPSPRAEPGSRHDRLVRVAKLALPVGALALLVPNSSVLEHRALIVVQDRDWQSLPPEARERVRALQREYVDVWATQLRRLHRGLHTDRARAMAHAAFGLINSTPHSGLIADEAMRGVLHRMALGALNGPVAGPPAGQSR